MTSVLKTITSGQLVEGIRKNYSVLTENTPYYGKVIDCAIECIEEEKIKETFGALSPMERVLAETIASTMSLIK